MPLQIIADKLDELPEVLRADAKEANGKFVTGLKDGWAVADESGLKKPLVEERRIRKLLEERLGEFGWKLSADGSKWNEGLSAEQAKAALEKLQSGALKSSKEIEDFKVALQEKASGEKKTLESERDMLRRQLEDVLIERDATAAISKHGGGKSLRALLPIVRSAARVEKNADGKLSVSLYDEAGRPLITKKSGSNDPMGFEEFVASLREAADLKPLFEGSGAGGAGSSSQQARGSQAAGQDSANLSPRELLNRANAQARAG